MSILKVQNLTKIYINKGNKSKTTALNKINFNVDKSEFTAIMGPSGSGKTSLLNLLSGIDICSSGNIEISGIDICNMKKNDMALFRRRHLGIVFQEYNLLDSLTSSENIMLPMILELKDLEYMNRKVLELAEILNIADILNKYPYEISGGQQQRVAICRALVNEPDIILADEPTGNLDSKSAQDVMRNFEKLNKLNKNTILMVTHDPFAASYCNKVIFIKDGEVNMEILKQGNRQEFLDEILKKLSLIGGCNNDI